jgi:hypothetical protein
MNKVTTVGIDLAKGKIWGVFLHAASYKAT